MALPAKDVRQSRDRTIPLRRTALLLGALIFFGTSVGFALGLVFRMPRFLGDELIYWDLSRSVASSGDFAVRGHPAGFGVLYPVLLAPVQRVASTPATAYSLARLVGSLAFASTVVPTYFLARRVVGGANLVAVSAMTALLPSIVYTGAILTENLFYPVFLTATLMMVRVLERPSFGRQVAFWAVLVILCLVRVQGIVLAPAYLVACAVLAARRRQSAAAVWRAVRAPIVWLAALGVVVAAFEAVRGRSPTMALGAYGVLVHSYDPLGVAKWFVFTLGDIDLYLGVAPLAALIVMASLLWKAEVALPDAAAVHVAVTVAAALAMTIAVAAFSATPLALGRVHERNVFYVVPLVLISFFAWIELGMPRPRSTALLAAVLAAVIPALLTRTVVEHAGGDDLALIPWAVAGFGRLAQGAAMLLICASIAAVFLFIPRRFAPTLPVLVLGVFATLLVFAVGADVRQQRSYERRGFSQAAASWVDDVVHRDARVAAVWSGGWRAQRRRGTADARLMHDYWNLEFFNNTVRTVAAIGPPLPDGLPFSALRVTRGGCVRPTAREPRPAYVVVDRSLPVLGTAVASDRGGRLDLYRVAAGIGCWFRLRRSAT
jgi:hypothetical protein